MLIMTCNTAPGTNVSVLWRSHPSSHPAANCASYVEEQQGHVRYEEDGGLEEVAPSEAEPPHEHSAEQPTKEDLLTDGPKRDSDGRSY